MPPICFWNRALQSYRYLAHLADSVLIMASEPDGYGQVFNYLLISKTQKQPKFLAHVKSGLVVVSFFLQLVPLSSRRLNYG
ncbi:hypothetical protein [Aeromonas veronii]|uniref:hypothetical protein n=1 Tax=Aeromonas veronii TaxID=654 RepID=UPI003308E26A|nr:hypothetical protein [Aeromonas veronii]HDO1355912.1 hypothetical protein [Aeromonas veronii]